MLRLLKWPVLTAAALALSGCAVMTVSSHVQPGLDIARYHTWRWTPPDDLPASDTRLNNPFFRDHFEGAVEKQFAARGFEQVDDEGGPADLLVHYHASIRPELVSASSNLPGSACYDAACTARVVEDDLSTMMIDVIDAQTNRLVWRAWAQVGANGVIDRPDHLASRISEAVTRMFARFPRTS